MNNKRFNRPFCLTVEEAAEQARVGPEQIRKWAKDFDFPSMKVGEREGKNRGIRR